MKRYIYMTAAACVAGLAGCGETDANRSQTQALEKFEQAFELQRQAVSGTIAEPIEDSPTIADLRRQGARVETARPFEDGTIEDYRQKKQRAAAEALSGISGVEQGQQQAAKLFIGETRASEARKLMRDASTAAAAQSDLHTRLVDAAASIRLNANFSRLHDSVSYDKQLAASQKAADEARAEQERLAGEVKKLQDRIKELQTQIAAFTETARAKAEESEALATRAFTAKGQAQYDLYVQSYAARDASDAATSKTDDAKSKLAIERAMLKVEEQALKSTEAQAQGLEAAIEALRKRAADTTKLAADAKARVEELLAKEFGPVFESVSANQTEKVNKAIDAAVEAMTEAVSLAEEASSQSPLHLHAARAELGHLNRQQLVVDTAYRDLLKNLQENLTEAQPDLAKSIGEAVTGVEARMAAAKERGAKELTQASDDLQQVADGGGDAGQQRLALRHLVHVHRGLASVTGDQSHAEKANQFNERIGTAGQEKPAE